MVIADKLLDAAESRMRKGGYNAVSFRDIAADVGIKSSSVHYHFPKKEDLAIALVERYSEQIFETLDEIAHSGITPHGKLKSFTKVYRMALIEEDTICLCGLLGSESGGLPDSLTQKIRVFFESNIKWVSGMLPGNYSRNERDKIASTVVAGHQGAMMLAISMNDMKIFDKITSTVVEQALSKA